MPHSTGTFSFHLGGLLISGNEWSDARYAIVIEKKSLTKYVIGSTEIQIKWLFQSNNCETSQLKE